MKITRLLCGIVVAASGQHLDFLVHLPRHWDLGHKSRRLP